MSSSQPVGNLSSAPEPRLLPALPPADTRGVLDGVLVREPPLRCALTPSGLLVGGLFSGEGLLEENFPLRIPSGLQLDGFLVSSEGDAFGEAFGGVHDVVFVIVLK